MIKGSSACATPPASRLPLNPLTGARRYLARVQRTQPRDRIKSVAAVAAIHAVLGYALILGLNIDVAAVAERSVKLIDVIDLPPPPSIPPPSIPPPDPPKPAERKAPDPEGAAAPPSLKAQAAPVVAPPPRILLKTPTPVVAAPIPGLGSAPTMGSAKIDGPGTGAVGQGTGTGSGLSGDGTGGGGSGGDGRRPPTRARFLSGRIANADWRDAVDEEGFDESVVAHFTVGPDGRARDCEVVESSGVRELDNITCAMIERRFRYRPATDGSGKPISEEMGWRQDYSYQARDRRRDRED